MKIGVKVMPKKEVLDTQGRAVQNVLTHHGFKLNDCRVGKFIEIEVENEAAIEDIKKMAQFVLFNPLIETYEVVKIG